MKAIRPSINPDRQLKSTGSIEGGEGGYAGERLEGQSAGGWEVSSTGRTARPSARRPCNSANPPAGVKQQDMTRQLPSVGVLTDLDPSGSLGSRIIMHIWSSPCQRGSSVWAGRPSPFLPPHTSAHTSTTTNPYSV